MDESSQSYALQYYDNDKTEQENENANANFSYNEEKKEATIVVSFTDANLYNKTYTVTTAAASELILYGVAPLPEVTSVQTDKKQYSNTDRTINLTWSGNKKMSDLEKLDVISSKIRMQIPKAAHRSHRSKQQRSQKEVRRSRFRKPWKAAVIM